MQAERGGIGHAYVGPTMLLVGFVLVAPSIYGLIYSLYDIRFLKATQFIALENYVYLVTDPAFVPLIIRSVIFTALAVGLTIVAALPVAIWIDKLKGMAGLVVQIVVILPWVVSSLIGALVFQWVYVSEVGWNAQLLRYLGVAGFHPIGSPTSAMTVLVLFAIWRTLGFTMLLLLGGLKSIPADFYEAAHADGASRWQAFRHVTLPMLKTPLMIAMVILTVSNLNNVEGPLIVTAGGPAGATDVLPHNLYTRAFGQFDFNSAIPLGIGMFIANILLAVSYVQLVKRNG